jgi:hypothetical protein
VHVDKSRGHHESSCVESELSITVHLTDNSDAVSVDGEIAAHRSSPGSIHEDAPADHDVVDLVLRASKSERCNDEQGESWEFHRDSSGLTMTFLAPAHIYRIELFYVARDAVNGGACDWRHAFQRLVRGVGPAEVQVET